MDYFLGKDMDSHNYLVPEPLREVWERYTQNDLDDEEMIEEFELLFARYRYGGAIDKIKIKQ